MAPRLEGASATRAGVRLTLVGDAGRVDLAVDPAAAGAALAEEYADHRFPSQADAESWIGESWPVLAEAGVVAVTLFELDRLVYGPMSLHA